MTKIFHETGFIQKNQEPFVAAKKFIKWSAVAKSQPLHFHRPVASIIFGNGGSPIGIGEGEADAGGSFTIEHRGTWGNLWKK